MPSLVTLDWAFKYIFRDRKNFEILEAFLSVLLKDSIKILEILESESNQETQNDRFNRVDLSAKDRHGKHIVIEMQIQRQWDYFYRMSYGASRLVVDHLSLKEAYGHIPPLISIHLVMFDLGGHEENDDWIYEGKTQFMSWHTQKLLRLSKTEQERVSHLFKQNLQQVHDFFPSFLIIKLSQFNEKDFNPHDPLHQWAYLFKNSSLPPTDHLSTGIQQAVESMDEMRMTPAERDSFKKHVDYIRTLKSFEMSQEFDLLEAEEKGRVEGKAEGIAEGKAEGIAEGRVEEKQKIAQSLKNMGLSVEQIQEATGLSVETIKNL